MYDFKALSPYDFELLTRDLLQRKLSIVLESFKGGKDGGIDFRHASSNDNSLVVQCKHYAKTGYRGLLASLKKEKAKVQRIAPKQYCIATSVSLSPANKKEISQLFHPFCRGENDVFGCEDLNNLLSLYPDIERQHFKLWLTSITVLDRLLHSDIYNQTAVMVEKIQQEARRYVQNQSFFDAVGILNSYNYCIISGIPGIGKTFLADILLLEFIRQGFEPVVVRSHISEAFRLLKATVRQVFYYDDFLGQTGWEDKLEKNEEQSILDFIAYVRTHKHAVFILTTREYILQQARSVYAKLHESSFDRAKCIVQLESYTRRHRAHILYNHLYFSDLPAEHRQVLCRKEHLLRIIDHKNYSPRIIQWMTGLKNVDDCSPQEYPTLFLATLETPTALWQHAFRKHVSPAARSMMVVLFSFQSAVDLRDLREAFNAFRFHEARLYGISRSGDEFESVLDELEGSFVRCEHDGDIAMVAFHNSSVRDFLEKHLAENSDLVLVLCESLVFYDQFRSVFTPQAGRHRKHPVHLAEGVSGDVLEKAALRAMSRTAKRYFLHFKADGSATTSSHVESTPEVNAAHALRMARQFPSTQAKAIAEGVLEQEEARIVSRLADLGEVPDILCAADVVEGVSPMRDRLVEAARARFEVMAEYEELHNLIALNDFIEAAPGVVSEELLQRVAAILHDESAYVFDWVISQADDEHELSKLQRKARDMEATFGVSLEEIHTRIDNQREEIEAHMADPPDDCYEDREFGAPEAEDGEILSMFASMFE